MERLLQYWDDLDDLVGACALVAERIRHLLLFTLAALGYLMLLATAIAMAFMDRPLALAVATVLLAFLLHRASASREYDPGAA